MYVTGYGRAYRTVYRIQLGPGGPYSISCILPWNNRLREVVASHTMNNIAVHLSWASSPGTTNYVRVDAPEPEWIDEVEFIFEYEELVDIKFFGESLVADIPVYAGKLLKAPGTGWDVLQFSGSCSETLGDGRVNVWMVEGSPYYDSDSDLNAPSSPTIARLVVDPSDKGEHTPSVKVVTDSTYLNSLPWTGGNPPGEQLWAVSPPIILDEFLVAALLFYKSSVDRHYLSILKFKKDTLGFSSFVMESEEIYLPPENPYPAWRIPPKLFYYNGVLYVWTSSFILEISYQSGTVLHKRSYSSRNDYQTNIIYKAPIWFDPQQKLTGRLSLICHTEEEVFTYGGAIYDITTHGFKYDDNLFESFESELGSTMYDEFVKHFTCAPGPPAYYNGKVIFLTSSVYFHDFVGSGGIYYVRGHPPLVRVIDPTTNQATHNLWITHVETTLGQRFDFNNNSVAVGTTVYNPSGLSDTPYVSYWDFYNATIIHHGEGATPYIVAEFSFTDIHGRLGTSKEACNYETYYGYDNMYPCHSFSVRKRPYGIIFVDISNAVQGEVSAIVVPMSSDQSFLNISSDKSYCTGMSEWWFPRGRTNENPGE